VGEPAILPFDWADPFDLEHQLTDEERLVRDTAEAYAQEQLQPRVTEAYLNEDFDREILREMGALGLIGATVPEEYGGAGLGYVSYGLIARAVERVDVDPLDLETLVAGGERNTLDVRGEGDAVDAQRYTATGRQRLSLGDVGPVEPGDVPDPCLWF